MREEGNLKSGEGGSRLKMKTVKSAFTGPNRQGYIKVMEQVPTLSKILQPKGAWWKTEARREGAAGGGGGVPLPGVSCGILPQT